MKYKHAMEIIENWERVEENVCLEWVKPACKGPGAYTVDALNNPNWFRIKREPRRVWVNIDKDGIPVQSHNTPNDAKSRADSIWCSESAVEFVEVIK